MNTEDPEVSCPNRVPSQDTDLGMSSAVVTWTPMPSATDNVDNFTINNITCQDESGNVVESDGTYSLGTTTVTCLVFDSAGNNGSCQFVINVVDTEDPEVSCPNSVPSQDTDLGMSSAVVTWTPMPSATDNVDNFTINNIICQDEAGNVVESDGTYSLGTTTVTCLVFDSAGNNGSCQFVINVVDTEDPEVSCPNSVPSQYTDLGMSSAVVTWTPMPSATDNVDNFTMNNITCQDEAGNVVESDGTYSLGTTTVTCLVFDSAGNNGSCQFVINVVDTEDPEVSCPNSVPSQYTDLGMSSAVVTWTPMPSATDNVDNFTMNNITCQDEAGNVVESDGTYSLGTTTVTCLVFDSTDTEDPEVSCPNRVPSQDTDLGMSSAVVTWTPMPSATDNVDNFTINNITCQDEAGNVVESDGTYSLGTTTVTCLVYDSAGNNGSCQFVINVVDTEDPEVSCPNRVPSQDTDLGMSSAVVTWTPMPSATDNVDNFTINNITCQDEAGNVVESDGTYSLGTTTVTCLVFDSARNNGSCQFVINVVDTEDPEVSCPNSVPSQYTDLGMSSAVVTWTPMPSATDNVDNFTMNNITCQDEAGNVVESDDTEDPEVSCPNSVPSQDTDLGMSSAVVTWTPMPSATDNVDNYTINNITCQDETGNVVESDGTYPLGTTTVTCLVFDSAGNNGSCQFVMNVVDTEDPEVSCPNRVPSQDTDLGMSSAVVTWTPMPSATDNVDNFTINNITCQDESGNVVESDGTYSLGTTTVTCLVFDSAGNNGSCQFVINVVDTEDPEVSCPNRVPSQDTDLGMSSAVVTWTPMPSATDNVDNFTINNITCQDEAGNVVESDGTYSLGTTTVTCLVFDSAGNNGSCQFVINVVDTEDPEVSCPNSVPSQYTDLGMSSAVVTWTPMPSATDNVDNFTMNNITCQDEAGNVVESDGTYSLGTTTVTCLVFDSARNNGSCQFVINVVDTEDPEVSCPNSVPSQDTDLGMSSAVVTWTPMPSATDNVDNYTINNITCQDETGNVVESDGTYPLGTTTVTCLVFDSAGNNGSCQFVMNVVDTEDPEVSCPNRVPSQDTDLGMSSAVVTWTPMPSATDNVDNFTINNITCQDESGNVVESDGTYSLGTTTVTCLVFDSAGNNGSCQFVINVVDTEDPEVSCPNRVPSQDTDLGMSSAVVTWTPMPSATDNVDNFTINNITCQDEAGNVVESDGTYSLGTTTVTCLVFDSAGNNGSCQFVINVVDTEDPEVSCPNSVPSQYTDLGMSSAVVTWTPMPSATDNVDNFTMNNITCQDEAGNVVESDGTYSLGTTTVTCLVFDSAGNNGSCQFVINVVDTEDPEVSCPNSVPSQDTDLGMSSAVVTWTPMPSATDNVDNYTINNITCQDETGNVVESDGTYPLGTTTVTCLVFDSAGNNGSCQFVINVVDTEDPEVSCPNRVPSQDTDLGMSSAVITWTPMPSATDNVDNFTINNITCQDEAGNVVESDGTYSLGTTTVTCLVFDSAGNNGSCQFVINVVDTEDPEVSCPNSVPSQNTDLGMSSAVVTWTPMPSATDNVDNFTINNITCQDEAGNVVESDGTYSLGTTTVTCLVFDSARNNGSCQFVINVVDTEDPEVSCPNSVPSQYTDLGMSSAVVTWTPMPSATDNVDNFTMNNITCQDEAGNVVESDGTYSLGTTTVTCLVFDSAGNNGSCQFVINVVDTEDPEVSCPNSVPSQDTDLGMSSAVVTWTPMPSATDNVDNYTINNITCQDETGNVVESDGTYPLGTTTVTCLVFDSAGNNGSCQFVINVVDTEDPEVSCPNRVPSQDTDLGMSSAVITWTPMPSATDNVDNFTINNITCQDEAGNVVESDGTYSLGTTTVTCLVFDSAGNNGSCQFVINVVDTEDPEVSCPNSVPSQNTDLGMSSAVVTWTPMPSATDNVDNFTINNITCQDEAGNVVESDGTYSLGTTTVTCLVFDSARNNGSCQFVINVVDTEDPEVSCPNRVPSQDTDLGMSSAVVTWTPMPSATDNVDNFTINNITCQDEAGNVVESDGTYSLGTTTVTCLVFDSAGNNGSCQLVINVVDTEDPEVSCPNRVPSQDTDLGMSSAVVTWTPMPSATDNVDNFTINNITCQDEAGNVVESDGTYSLGTTTVTCLVFDSAGNNGSCQFVINVVDTEDPELSCPNSVPSQDTDLGMSSAVVTWTPMPSATDNVDNFTINNITCQDEAGNVVESDDTYSLGTTTVTCLVFDSAGNNGSCQFVIYVVDTEDPEVSCPNRVPSQDTDLGMSSAVVTWTPMPSATDNVDNFTINNITCQDEAGNVVESDGTYSLGTTTVTCLVFDSAGNNGSCQFVINVVDTEDPEVSCPNRVPSQDTDLGMSSAVVTWTPMPSATDNVDNFTINSITCQDEAGNVVESDDTYSLGTTTVTCLVFDSAGNNGSCQFVINVVDTEDPEVSCPNSVPSQDTDLGMSSAVVTWTPMPSATDNVDNFTINNITCQDEAGNVVESDGTYSLGTTTVTCLVFDSAGNNGSCQFVINVVDTEDPEVSCPNRVPSQDTDLGMSSAVVTWTPMPSATDNVDNFTINNITCQDEAGNVVESDGTYSLGTTTVTCLVLDSAGNNGSCQFVINVVDTEDPEVSCPTSVPSQDTDLGMSSAVVTWTPMPSANDNVDNFTINNITCQDEAGNVVESDDTYSLGTTTVTCLVFDSAGNNGSCQFVIYVVDTEDPEVSCPNRVPSQDTDLGMSSAVVTWTPMPSATDNVDNFTINNITCQDEAGNVVESDDTYSLGTTTVTCLVFDSAGNNGSCQFVINVVDTEDPEVSCPNRVPSQDTDLGMSSAVVTWTPMPSATDNVDNFTINNITCQDEAGNVVESDGTYSLGTTTVTCLVFDSARNNGSCQFVINVVDTEDPEVSCPNSVPSQDTDLGMSSAVVTWTPMPSATDNVDNFTINNITCQDEAGNVVESDGTYSLGTTTVTCLVFDSARNNGSCQFVINVVDTEDPEVSCPNSVPSQDTDLGMSSAVVTWTPMPSATDNVDNFTINNITCQDEAGNVVESDGTYSLGTTTVTCLVFDSARNNGSCQFVINVVDTEDPEVSCPNSVLSQDTDLRMSSAVVTWTPMPSATDNVDNFTINNITCQDEAGNVVESDGTYTLGTTTVTCLVFDSAGNNGSCQFVINVVDTEDPEVSCPNSVSSQNTDLGMSSAVVTWTPMPSATDNVDNFTINNITCQDEAGNVVESDGTYSLGTTTVTCLVFDSARNNGSCQFVINVVDTEDPEVSCPNSVPSQDTDLGMSSAVVTWTPMPSATDNVDNFTINNITCQDEAGNVVESDGTYSLGTTTVTCLVFDSARNNGSCQFVINVVDNEDPEVSCPNSVPSQDTDLGMSSAVVTWTPMPSATDNVDNFTINNITCQDEAGNVVESDGTYSLGTTTVTCLVFDSARNNGSCQFVINVVDTEDPEVSCPNSVLSQDTDLRMSSAVVTWTPMPSATDNVDNFTINNITCQDEAGNVVESDGTYTLGTTTVTCLVFDSAGNNGSCQFVINVVDTEDPEVSCPNSVSSQNTDLGMSSAVVTWTPMPSATDNVDNFTINNITCQDEAGNVVESDGTYSLGTTTVTCLVFDSARNNGSCQFVINVVDTEDPEVSCPNSVPSQDTDLGMSSAVVTWTPMPSATDNVDNFTINNITCQDEAGNVVESDGTYTLGTTTVTCLVFDSAGNNGSCQFVINVVDTEDPEVSCPNSVPSQNTDLGMSSAVVTWTPMPSATDNVDNFTINNITCQDEAGNVVESDGTYSLGTTTVTCLVFDSARNNGSCQFVINVVDTEDPEVSCPNSVPSQDTDLGMSSAVVTWTPMPSATDNVDNFTINNITCQDEAGNVVESDGTYTLGTTTVTCLVFDSAGNNGSCQFVINVVDTEDPEVSCPNSVSSQNTDLGMSSAVVTWTPMPSATDNVDNFTINNITCQDEAGNVVESDGTYSLGTTTVTCLVFDSARNNGSCQFVINVVDTDDPEVSCPNSVPSQDTDLGMSSAVVTWTPMPSATDNVDNFTINNITCQDEAGNVVESDGTYTLGTTTVTCLVFDSARNNGSCQFVINVVDTEDPEVSCPNSVSSQNTDLGMSSAVVTWTPMPSATDNVDNFTINNITCQDEAGNVVESDGTYSLGTTTVTCLVFDSARNNGSCQFVINVVDTEDPEVSCPNSVPSQDTDLGMSSAVVTWTPMPSATDNVDNFTINNITCQDEAGNVVESDGTYTLGTTTVTCLVFDSAGNNGSCQFVINVVDTEDPEVSCPNSVSSQNTDLGMSSAVVTWTQMPSATDNVDNFTINNITCQDEAGNVVESDGTYSLGTTTVTCLVFDSARNNGSCQFVINVVDTEDPDVSCPNSVPSQNTDLGMSSAVVTWTPMQSATDNVDNFIINNITCQDEAGNVVESDGTYSLGTTTVTCLVFDSARNNGSCQFVINVVDTEDPEVSCPNSVPSQNTDLGMSSAVVTWTPMPSATDNVDNFTINNITCQDEAGNVVESDGTYSLGTTTVTCLVFDSARNNGSCQFVINVVDTEDPEVSCPNSVPSQNTDLGMSSTVVTWTPMPSATDNVDNFTINNITCQDEAGNVVESDGTYSLGTTTVTCLVFDSAGNNGSCQFVINVVDTEDPEVSCPNSVPSQDTDLGMSSAVVTWIPMPSATDNVDNLTVNNITCNDEAGNIVVSNDCQVDQHKCSNGVCIPRSQVCDNFNDCGDHDNSDENSTMCSSDSYTFCQAYSNVRELCIDQSGLLSIKQSFLEGNTAVYTFTAPRLFSKSTYLSKVNDDHAVVAKELRVPLPVDPGQNISVTIEYITDTQSSSTTPVNVTCLDCITLYYRTYLSGCECLTEYTAWRRGILSVKHIYNTTCGVPETNEMFFSMYDKCLEQPSFTYISPDVTSFQDDEVTLSCLGTGDIPPLVEWIDGKGTTLQSSLNSVYLKVAVADSPKRFRCLIDNFKPSREVTVAKWGCGCEDVYFAKKLKVYRSAPRCYSPHLLSSSSLDYNYNFNMAHPAIAHKFSIKVNSTIFLKIIPLLTYDVRITSPGKEYLLYYYNQEYRDGYGTMLSLNDTAMKLDLQLVPPVALEIGVFNVILSVMSSQGVEDLLQGVLMTAQLSVIQCEQGDDCEAFFKEWTGLETEFKELKCGNGLQQEYMSYQQCRESSAPGPAPVVSPSARYLIEVPSDLPSNQPFPVECPIENAASYEWYRINSDGQRDFVTNGYALIFPSFEELRNQGAYVCVGRGRGPLINVTAEYQAIIMKSGITTLMANMTLVNGTFTDELRNASSAAFKNLTDELRSKMPLDMIYQPVVSYEVLRFYPGSVIVVFKVIVDSPSNVSDAHTVLSLQTAMSAHASTNPGLGLDPNSVTVVSLSSCPREVLELEGKNVIFPQTRVGLWIELLGECVAGEKHGRVLITRDCSGDFTMGAQWLQPVLGNCSVDVNGQLDILKKITVTSENVVEVSESLESLTNDASSINGEAVALVADVLDNILTIRDPSPEITSSVVSVVNNLLQVDDEAFDKVPDRDSTASRFVQALDSQISYVLADGANFTAVTPSLAVEALNIPPNSLDEGVGFVVIEGESTDGVLKNDSVSVYYSVSDYPAEKVESSIHLLMRYYSNIQQVAASPVPISFTVYQTSKLFSSKLIADAESNGSRRFVDSAIISATVVGVHVENLPEDNPVVVTFGQNPVMEGTVQCVFWDNELQDGVGDWSPEGCRLVTSISGRTECHCDHATSFAVLVDIHGQKYSSLALDIISKIGCAVSIASLVFTIIIYLAIKSLREKTPSRILVCFSFSLLCLYLVFLVGIEQTSSRIGCIIVAVLMHYFTLSSMAWMGVEATNLYLKLVRVFNSNVEHFMVKASIAAWGMPMIVVGVILAVDYTVYENESSCFLKPGAAFYYGQLLMIGLVFLYNAFIFVLIARRLTCKAKVIQSSNTKGKRSQMAKRLQNMAAISVLLGLTWAFGLLSVIESSNFVFQILFCVFNSLQGLFIFLLFVVRQDNVRGKVLGCFHKTPATSGSFSPSVSNTKFKSQSRLTDVGDGGNGIEGYVPGKATDPQKKDGMKEEEENVYDNQAIEQLEMNDIGEGEENASDNEAIVQLQMDEMVESGVKGDHNEAMDYTKIDDTKMDEIELKEENVCDTQAMANRL
ncbi:uncharacterized protein LOC119731913 [Patiria miniata]|uniref:Hyalin n=1 Tax=Patiria miniata TaxID=46514 RepID=A0A914AB58_PATMI|nr:uncharacterized protein LOC119731913 [Patiria miniata]